MRMYKFKWACEGVWERTSSWMQLKSISNSACISVNREGRSEALQPSCSSAVSRMGGCRLAFLHVYSDERPTILTERLQPKTLCSSPIWKLRIISSFSFFFLLELILWTFESSLWTCLKRSTMWHSRTSGISIADWWRTHTSIGSVNSFTARPWRNDV